MLGRSRRSGTPRRESFVNIHTTSHTTRRHIVSLCIPRPAPGIRRRGVTFTPRRMRTDLSPGRVRSTPRAHARRPRAARRDRYNCEYAQFERRRLGKPRSGRGARARNIGRRQRTRSFFVKADSGGRSAFGDLRTYKSDSIVIRSVCISVHQVVADNSTFGIGLSARESSIQSSHSQRPCDPSRKRFWQSCHCSVSWLIFPLTWTLIVT